MRLFRIFIASPGDVYEERDAAVRVIQQLNNERRFSDQFKLQAIGWDQPGMEVAMAAGKTPQQVIDEGLPRPSDCDLVVTLFWSRMGSPLEEKKPDGSRYESGTEWEYLEALNAYKNNNKPDIWLFRRQGKPQLDIDDPEFGEKRDQWLRLESFFSQSVTPNNTIIRGENYYQSLVEFERKFKQYLRDHLERLLNGDKAQTIEKPVSIQQPVKQAEIVIEKSPSPTPQRTNSASNELAYPDLETMGEDDYGRWRSFDFHGVKQVFRWIPPGRFLMGSPASEPGRYDDETLHRVKLTQGFWLGDTTISQGLWRAVMGSNPSRFRGDDLPVENVIWNDVQEFLLVLSHDLPKLNTRLPTEAEWEYACRAGKRTPFSFGGELSWEYACRAGKRTPFDGELSSELANFNGTQPYNEGAKSQFREKTVGVKSFHANRWGLYQMHGNVWEWCEDEWQDDLGPQPQVDPRFPGSNDSERRVVRGGSWDDGGRGLRSACRGWGQSGNRHGILGFRLALGPELQPSDTEK